MRDDPRLRTKTLFETEDGKTFTIQEEASQYLLEKDLEDALFNYGIETIEATPDWVLFRLPQILEVAEKHGLCAGKESLAATERTLQSICCDYEDKDPALVGILVEVLRKLGLDPFYPHRVPSRA